MRKGERYKIVRSRVGQKDSKTVAIIIGYDAAVLAVERYNGRLAAGEIKLGWSHHLEKYDAAAPPVRSRQTGPDAPG